MLKKSKSGEGRPVDLHQQMIDALRYHVILYEDGHGTIVAMCRSEHQAKKVALASVDDALPRNTVHVVDCNTGKNIGYAYLAGDGSDAWSDAK